MAAAVDDVLSFPAAGQGDVLHEHVARVHALAAPSVGPDATATLRSREAPELNWQPDAKT